MMSNCCHGRIGAFTEGQDYRGDGTVFRLRINVAFIELSNEYQHDRV